ncbi:MAG: Mrp/NBP35 family ATP-binding protein [Candidatus Eisenbacteria bacterium]|nr:Mrp/NBP35 family ATP-binding protein [Candidatus Eisenbacteria bacterium]
MVEKERILDALREVRFPGLERDIVSLGYVRGIAKDGDRWRVALEIATNDPAAAGEIEADVRRRFGALGVPFELDLSLPHRQAVQPGQLAPGAVDLLAGVPLKIAVASGKGGVGKSTVAVNLAVALASLGKAAGLLDCDIYGPSVPLMLGMENERPLIADQKLLPLQRHGVRSMSIGYLVDRATPVIWRGPMVGKALEQLMTDVAWDGIDTLVLDLPPGTGDAQISIAQLVALSGAVIVTTPQDVALIDAGKGAAMFEKVHVRVLGLIENMSYFACPHCGERTEIFRGGGGRREAMRLGIPLLGEIPIDPRIPVGGDLGSPVVAEAPDSEAGRAFLAAARALLDALGAGATVGRT